MNIVLIGMKNSGKSSVGKILSMKLNKQFFDTDEILKNLFLKKFSNKKNISNIFEIFKILKEEKFRLLESDVFFSIKNVENSVIATGGGAILNEKNFQILKKPKIIVYLKASIEILKKRIQKQKNENVNINEKFSIFQDQKFFEKIFYDRKDLYEKLSDITIQSENKDVEETAVEIRNKIFQKRKKLLLKRTNIYQKNL